MFKRVFSVVMVSILLVTAVLAGLACVRLRNERINNRLDALKSEARDIAYLAGQSSSATLLGSLYSIDQDWMRYLSRKATQVYEEFGAYILVVDRRGRVMDNMRSAYEEDPDFVASLSEKEISEGLTEVLGGNEISLKTDVGGSPTFTVGVPFIQNNVVYGAVFIQTKAQSIEDGLGDIMLEVAATALSVILLAGAVLWFFVRRAMEPLHRLTRAAGAMADGEFTPIEVPKGADPEVAELTQAFSQMAGRLQETENSRREFVANVSHELRSPITSISGFVEGMLDGVIPQEEHPKYLALVSAETKRLSRLIGDLLALSRLEKQDAALQVSSFDICEMLRRCLIRRMNDLEGKQLEPVFDLERENMTALADPDRIEQVVVNLLDNAIKFTPEGGRITLRCREKDDRLRVTVADNGIGVPPEDRDKVFQRFFTADRAHTSGKGTGLGLSICQRILQMHGESIVLDDTQEGASFTFTLKKGESRHGEAV